MPPHRRDIRLCRCLQYLQCTQERQLCTDLQPPARFPPWPAAVPGPEERALAWRDGLAAGARTLTRSSRHGLARGVVEQLLREVSDACGQPPVTGW